MKSWNREMFSHPVIAILTFIGISIHWTWIIHHHWYKWSDWYCSVGRLYLITKLFPSFELLTQILQEVRLILGDNIDPRQQANSKALNIRYSVNRGAGAGLSSSLSRFPKPIVYTGILLPDFSITVCLSWRCRRRFYRGLNPSVGKNYHCRMCLPVTASSLQVASFCITSRSDFRQGF